MPDFTPGPWEYQKTSIGHFVMAGRYCVASMGDRGTAKGEANGKLIAAAPDMYEALKEVYHLLEEFMPSWYTRRYYNLITNALAKAEGRETRNG